MPSPILLVQERHQSRKPAHQWRQSRSHQGRHQPGLAHIRSDFSQYVKQKAEDRAGQNHSLHATETERLALTAADVAKLLEVLFKLRASGNTLLVIEHNLDVIKSADWIVDLGPEGGDAGGQIIAEGAPEHVAQSQVSHTGRYLKDVLSSAGNVFPSRVDSDTIAE